MTAESVPSRPPELMALTGLRAAAALAVVLSHTGVPASCPSPIRKATEWGYVGVPLFFMLSGVVLAYNYSALSPSAGRKAIMRFYRARFARVMPLYWFMIIFCVIMRMASSEPQFRKALLQNILAVQAWGADLNTAQYRYNGPGWSIGVELFFYAVFPFLVPLVGAIWENRGPSAIVVLIGVCFVISVTLWLAWVVPGWTSLPAEDERSAHRWLYRNPLPHLPEFTVGVGLAFLLQGSREKSARQHSFIQFVAVVVIGALASLHPVGSAPLVAASYGVLFIAPFALLLWSLGSDKGFLAKFFSSSWVMSLGVSSFALYLTHVPVLSHLTLAQGVRSDAGLRSWAALLLVMVILLLVAEGAHRSIEVPCRRMMLRSLPGVRGGGRAHPDAVPKERSRYRASRRT